MSWKPKDPGAADWYYFIWCDPQTGLNDGSANDDGELQGATISSFTVTVPSGLNKVSESTAALTVQGVTYPASTLVGVKVSGGTAGQGYNVECQITTSDGRENLKKTERLPIKEL